MQNLDPMGIQGRRYLNETTSGILKDMSIWTRPLIHDEYVLAAVSFRTDGIPQPIKFKLNQLDFKDLGKSGGVSLFLNKFLIS